MIGGCSPARALGRILALAGAAILCAFLAGAMALISLTLFLPSSDSAYGMSPWHVLRDPFVRDVWFPLVGIGAALGFTAAVFMLWSVKLAKALPRVIAMTVLAAALGACIFAPLGVAAGLALGLATMVWCRRQARTFAEWRFLPVE